MVTQITPGFLLRFCLIGLAVSTLTSCGGGGGSVQSSNDQSSNDQSSNDQSSNDQSSNDQSSNDQAPTPELEKEFPDFAVQFDQGDYWEYAWDQERVTGSSDGTSSNFSSGRFRVTVGDAVSFGRRQGFDIEVTGTPPIDIRWQALAFDDDGLYASSDGIIWDTLFDAVTGYWPGGGFIAVFDPDVLTTAADSSVANAYIDQPAVEAGESQIQNQCEVIAGITFCGDESSTIRQFEYYDPIVGVIAYEYVDNSSDSGGGFSTMFNFSRNVGLVASSLRGDAVDYRLEMESNNQPVSATVLDSGEMFVGHGAREDDFGDPLEIFVGFVEQEPNHEQDSTADLPVPNLVTLPHVVRGQIASMDAGFAYDDLIEGAPFNRVIEDFYEIELGGTGDNSEDHCRSLGFSANHLDLTGGGRLDLVLFEAAEFGLNAIASDIISGVFGVEYRNNIYQESLLPGGRYFLGVDAVDVPVDTPYEIYMDCGYFTSVFSVTGSAFFPGDGSIRPSDWYRVELLAAGPLTIESTGARFVLTDETGQTLFAYTRLAADPNPIDGDVFGLQIDLQAGSYRIGVVVGDDEDEYRISAIY